jgi:hypothetical protein
VAAPRLTIAGLDGPRDVATIIDAGSATTTGPPPDDGRRYAVLRGLALSTLVTVPELRPDGVILIAEPGRSLTAADTSAILGIPVVATVPVRPPIARLIDAGLLAGQPFEVPGLDHLTDAVVRGAEPFTGIVGPGAGREHGLPGTTRRVRPTPSWGHEL